MDSIQGYDQTPSRLNLSEAKVDNPLSTVSSAKTSKEASESNVSLTDLSKIGQNAKEAQSEIRPDAIARAQALLDDPGWLNDRAIEALADKLIDIEGIWPTSHFSFLIPVQYDKIAKSYKAQSVQTATPGKLVLMLFDGYLKFSATARRGFDEEDLTKKNEMINNNLIKAQNIVTELQSSLDMSVPGELPGTLYRLYDYVLHQLQQANLQKKVEPIDEADKVISELREAWAEMLTQNPDGRASGDQQSGSISLQAWLANFGYRGKSFWAL